MERERDLLTSLLRDVEVRRDILGMAPTARDTLLVWKDFAQAWEHTEVDSTTLPRWTELGEYMKIHLLFQLILMFGGFSFTIRIRPDLQTGWTSDNALDRIKRLIGGAIKQAGLSELEYFYVVESKSRRGSPTALHLHGFCLAESATIATKLKVALSGAIADHPKGKSAAGYAPKSGPSIEIKAAYVKTGHPREIGRTRWPDYILKHARKADARLVGRRIHISRAATQTVRAFWDLILEEVDLNRPGFDI